MQHDRDDEAALILGKLNIHSDAAEVATDIAEIKEAIALEEHAQKSWFDLFRGDKIKSRRRVLLAVGINIMQNFSGSTPISYYTTYM